MINIYMYMFMYIYGIIYTSYIIVLRCFEPLANVA